MRIGRIALLLAGLGLALSFATGASRAHDVPNQILVQSFVRPAGERLHVLLRVPLAMLENAGLPKRGPGYLDLPQVAGRLDEVTRALAARFVLMADGRDLVPETVAARISQLSERVFESYEQAYAHVTGPPLPAATNVFWNQGYLDAHLVYPIASERAQFALDMRLGGLAPLVTLVVRFLPPGGEVRAYQIHAGAGVLVLDPRWHQAGATFLRLGIAHILQGIDHLLFLICLILPFAARDFWNLVAVVTAFTVAHSITLIAAALGVVPAGNWFPPLVEVLIAASIVYMALENIARGLIAGWWGYGLGGRWLVTGAFGLVHGFGFSFALREELQLAGNHLLLSLLAFNLGVEVGQILIVVLVLPLLALAAGQPALRRVAVLIASALVAHVAWHWLEERAAALQYVQWPRLDAGTMTLLLGTAALLVLAAVLAWLIARQIQRLSRRE